MLAKVSCNHLKPATIEKHWQTPKAGAKLFCGKA
jgi:hypothetical protein